MKRAVVVLLILLISAANIFAETGSIRGTVLNSVTNLPLTAVNVLIGNSSIGTSTDERGEFTILKINPGEVTLVASYVGFKKTKIAITVEQNKTTAVKILLEPYVISVGETIVTGSKYEKQIKDIAMPLEVIKSNEIKAKPPVTISDALQNLSGVSLIRDGIWGTTVSIRGLSKQNIVTLIDGNRIETGTNIAAGLSMIDAMDVERIEVIKGASSSLYGSGALGGVVNIISKDGKFNDELYFGGSIISGYSSVNNGGRGRLSINAGSANWFAKISGTKRSADNTQTPEGTLENSQFRDNNISAAVGAIPFSNHELKLTYQRFYAEDVGIPGGAPFPKTAKASYPEEKREMFNIAYRIKNLLPSMTNLSLKYFNQKIERRVKIIPNPKVELRPNADHNTNGVQLQTDWLIGESNYLVAGIDAWQRELDSRRTREIKPANQIIGERPVPISDYRSIGFFVQDDLKLIKNVFKITIGGRVDQIKVTNKDAFNPEYIISNGVRNDLPPNRTELWKAGEADDISASANIGLLFSAAENIDLTFNAAQSFRSPNLEERYQYIELGAATYLGDPNLEPEKGTFFDIGVRVREDNFTIRGNVFLNFLNDLVIDQFKSENLFVKENVGKARLYGFDLNSEVNFYKNSVIYASLAYVRGEDTEKKIDLPEMPPLNGLIAIRTPITQYFNADLSANFSAKQNKIAEGEQATAGYVNFNFYLNTTSLNFAGVGNRLMIGVENIFDKAYRNHLSTNRGIIKVEPGRNFIFQWQMDF
ncbi:MAG: TonB-dependent receptor [Ignavibacteriae bacterium]|nr:TonB-dependent receptor [Ignavibacteriota bacterium]